MNKSDLSNIKLIEGGQSWSKICSATYKGREVIVKVQKQGSRDKADPKDDRFNQELKVLSLCIENTVDLIGQGNDFDGERFIVLEKLYPLPDSLPLVAVQEFVKSIIIASRKLYLRGFNWVSTLKHVMVDKDGVVKILDFNDDNIPTPTFRVRPEHYDVFRLCEQICNKYGVDKVVIQYGIDNLIKEEYASCENVHEPVYFERYHNLQRTETESDDPNYLKRVAPNRNCLDREKMILDAVKGIPKGKRCLDIGCNMGWFTFLLDDEGYDATGIDFDKPGEVRPEDWKNGMGGKLALCNLVSEIYKVDTHFDFANVDVKYVKNMPKYDVILALSILHLYFTQHKVTREYWIELFGSICDKTEIMLIFETSKNILPNLKLESFEHLAEFAKDIGGFKKAEIIGTSDANRPLIVCTR